MTSTAMVTMPNSALPFIREIERLGFKFQYVPQYALADADPAKRRVQVRESDHYAPPAGVKAFAQALKGGVVFPPLVTTIDNFLVDGNTRVEAGRQNKMPHFHALVITTPYEKASPETRDKFIALAATLNQLNGVRLTLAEAKMAAIALIRLGWTIPNIQRSLGLNQGLVYRISREQEALQRITRLGMIAPAAAYLSNAGTKQMLALNDEPYKRLILLMTDANLRTREIKEIAEEAKNAGSDQAANDVIKKHRDALEQRILDHALTGNGKPSKGAKFRQAMGRVLSYEGNEADGVEHVENQRVEHTELLERAKLVLEKVITLQREVAGA